MHISLCVAGFTRLGLTIDAYYLSGSNRPRDFKFARVVRSRYLVSLYTFNILLNVCDKNPLYGIYLGSDILTLACQILYSRNVWPGGKFGEFSESFMIRQTKTIQISNYN